MCIRVCRIPLTFGNDCEAFFKGVPARKASKSFSILAPLFQKWRQTSQFEMYFAPKHQRCCVQTRLESKIKQANPCSSMVGFQAGGTPLCAASAASPTQAPPNVTANFLGTLPDCVRRLRSSQVAPPASLPIPPFTRFAPFVPFDQQFEGCFHSPRCVLPYNNSCEMLKKVV
jgi:hypothetical protein